MSEGGQRVGRGGSGLRVMGLMFGLLYLRGFGRRKVFDRMNPHIVMVRGNQGTYVQYKQDAHNTQGKSV